MKRVSIPLIAVILITLASCSKKDSPAPRQQGDFVKTIELTFPVGGITRSSTFGYDEKNRIKDFDFEYNGREYTTTFTYNDADLVTRADIDVFTPSTGHNYGYILEFRYNGDILEEYKENGTSTPVTYNEGTKTYGIFSNNYHWDANNNLKKITNPSGASTFLDINYLSGSGVFKEGKVQMAFALFSAFLARGMDPGSFHHALEHFAFSRNEIGGFDIPVSSRRYFYTAIRNDAGNITAYEVENSAGDMVRKYEITYEKRNID